MFSSVIMISIRVLDKKTKLRKLSRNFLSGLAALCYEAYGK